MKIDGSTLLQNLVKSTRPPAAQNSSAPAEPSDKFSSLPHADFDTNRAKLMRTGGRELRQPENELRPNYSEPITDTDVNQSGFQKELIANLGSQFARMQYTQDCSKLNGTIPTQTQLQTEFDKLAADPSIPFEYIVDGCYGRAHLMCDQMMDDGINNAKMFVMVENPYGKGKLTAENKYMQAKWWYHVAPMVFAVDEKTQKVEPFIMDPSMAPTPLKAQDWIHAMWDEKTKIKIDITHNPQFGPLESDGPNATFEESIEPSKEILAEYSKELEKIKQDYDAQHPPAQRAA